MFASTLIGFRWPRRSLPDRPSRFAQWLDFRWAPRPRKRKWPKQKPHCAQVRKRSTWCRTSARLRGDDDRAVEDDIALVAAASHRGGAIVKVILETALLNDDQKIVACRLAQDGRRGLRENLHRFRSFRRDGSRRRADAPRGWARHGRESVGRNPHAGRSAENDGRRSHAHRRQRQRQDRRSRPRRLPNQRTPELDHGRAHAAKPKFVSRSAPSCSISCWMFRPPLPRRSTWTASWPTSPPS